MRARTHTHARIHSLTHMHAHAHTGTRLLSRVRALRSCSCRRRSRQAARASTPSATTSTSSSSRPALNPLTPWPQHNAHTHTHTHTRCACGALLGVLRCDILSPCAYGGVLHAESVAKIKARIVCGAANNREIPLGLSPSLGRMTPGLPIPLCWSIPLTRSIPLGPSAAELLDPRTDGGMAARNIVCAAAAAPPRLAMPRCPVACCARPGTCESTLSTPQVRAGFRVQPDGNSQLRQRAVRACHTRARARAHHH